jgi:hypothetical protein
MGENSAAAAAAAERAQAASRVRAWRAKEMPTRQPLAPPVGPADFTRQFALLKNDPARLFQYVQLIPPGRCEAVFVPEMPPEVLQAIAGSITQHATRQAVGWAAEWLGGLTRVRRFGMSMLMLDAPVARALDGMFDALDALASGGGAGQPEVPDGIAAILTDLRAKFR